MCFFQEFFKEEMPTKPHALWMSVLGYVGDGTEQNCPKGLSSEQPRDCIYSVSTEQPGLQEENAGMARGGPKHPLDRDSGSQLSVTIPVLKLNTVLKMTWPLLKQKSCLTTILRTTE